MSKRITVFVCDDDEAVCDAVSMLLESVDIAVRGFSNAEALLAEISAENLPDCIVADVRMPGMGGIALHQTMVEQFPSVPVIIITGHADVPMAVELMKSGVADFLSKPFRDQELIDAVQRSAQRAEKSAPAAGDPEWDNNVATLTPREKDVLSMLCDAKTNKLIAYELGISTRTLDIHRARVLEKMQLRNVNELLLKMPRS